MSLVASHPPPQLRVLLLHDALSYPDPEYPEFQLPPSRRTYFHKPEKSQLRLLFLIFRKRNALSLLLTPHQAWALDLAWKIDPPMEASEASSSLISFQIIYTHIYIYVCIS